MTIALLHPLPLSGEIWANEMRSLAPHTITPTLYEFGDSIGQWAEGILDMCEPGPIVVVGNSVGGSCALEVAHRARDRVALLVLIGAKAGHRPEPDFRDEALRLLDEDGVDAAWKRYWEPLFGPRVDPNVVREARDVAQRQGARALATGVRVFHSRPDRSEFARSLDVPIVFVSGEFDAPARSAAAASEAVSGTFHEVAGVGHYVPLEAPNVLTSIVAGAVGAL